MGSSMRCLLKQKQPPLNSYFYKKDLYDYMLGIPKSSYSQMSIDWKFFTISSLHVYWIIWGLRYSKWVRGSPPENELL